MKTNFMNRQLSFFLCIVLIVVMALSAAGCNGNTDKDAVSASAAETEKNSASEPEKESDDKTDDNVLGEGNTQFDFTVVDQNGSEAQFEIHTDKETVGEALQELDLIEGDESEYGLYVKTVNGITADYDKNGVYWAFYINDEYAQTGVDATTITDGDSYAFKVE